MKSLFLLLKILCAWFAYGIGAESSYPISPCPDVFSYESFNPNNDHWFGVILISTDEVLDGIRLGIRFDRPVDLLVSWTGEVTTTNNEQFTILNLNKRLQPGDHVYSSRFRVKYSKSRGGVPQLKNVHLNGRQICSADSTTGGKNGGATRRPDPVFGFEAPSITNNYENHNTRTTTGSNLFTYTEAEYYRPTSKRPQEQYNNKPQPFESGGDIERPYVRPTHNNNGELESNHNHYSNGGSDIYGNYNYESTTTYPKTSSVPSRPVYYGQENPSYSNSNNNNNNYNNNESTTKKSSTSNSQKQQSSSSSSTNTSSSSNGNKKNPKQPPKTSNSNHSSTSTSSNNSNRYTTTTERNSYVKTTPKQSWSSSQTNYNNGHNNTRDVSTIGGHANPVMSRPDESNNVYHHTNSHTDSGKRGQSTTTSNYNGLSDETGSKTYECGKVDDDVVRDQAVTLIVMGENTVRGQWPWHVALYRAGINLNLEYICGGTLVDLQTVITAAHCTAKNGMNRPVDPDTLIVYLGKYHSLQYSDELVHSGLQSRQVREIHINPAYNNTNFLGDISVLKLSSPVQYTKYVRPCCLWRFQSSVIGKEGVVVGWGINEKGVTPDELKMAKMPVVSNEQCLNSNQPFFSMFTAPGMTFCAGYRAGTTVCNGDSGGGMVFNQNSKWYLRGSVSLAVARQGLRICDTNHYVIFTDIVKYLDWIDQFLT